MAATENKMEFIKELEALVNKTRALDGLVIEIGYREYKDVADVDGIVIREWKFIPSTERFEWLRLHWKDQDTRFGRLVPIEGDSCWGIMIDFMKVVTKWI